MPSGVMGMAQGATPTPVKPNVMGRGIVSWNRAVEDAKNTGGCAAHPAQIGVSVCISSQESCRPHPQGAGYLKEHPAEFYWSSQSQPAHSTRGLSVA